MGLCNGGSSQPTADFRNGPKSGAPLTSSNTPVTPSSVTEEVRRVLVGTWNMMGDTLNPFEFLPLGDSEFLAHYSVLRDRFETLEWKDLEPLASAVLEPRTSAPPWAWEARDKLQWHSEHGGLLWSFFTEEVLKNDNKLLDDRINLLTTALKPIAPSSESLQCQLWGTLPHAPWIKTMHRQLRTEGAAPSYVADSNLFLWDIFCNAVTADKGCKSAYSYICRNSSLHPHQYTQNAERLLGALRSINPKSLPVVLGLQEFPARGSDKAVAYEQVLMADGFKVLRGEHSTAILYRGLGEAEPAVLTAGAVDPTAVMRQCIEAEGASLTAPARKGLLETTAAKTLVVNLGSILFIVIHAKEPKDPTAAVVLASYMGALVSASQIFSAAQLEDWVVLSDTNIGKEILAIKFVAALEAHKELPEIVVVPSNQTTTTAKHRSILHGQCYDNAKVGVTVAAPKDRIVAPKVAGLSPYNVFPQLGKGGHLMTLPTQDWASDHSLVTAVYTAGTKGGSAQPTPLP